jgi:hypothetical protein
MATLFPPYALDPDYLDAGSDRLGLLRERETLQLLGAALPAAYTIFHSTHLAWRENGTLRKREADFLVVNQAGDVLMIEQKSGHLDETPEGLTKTYDGTRKSVVRQCNEIADALHERFKSAYGVPLNVGVLLYCPDHRIQSFAIAGLAPAQIIDAPDRRGLVQRIRALLPEGRPNAERLEQVRAMLSQELVAKPDPAAQAELGERVLTRLTDDLLDFLMRLEMTPYRLRVDGAAGCGKTRMVTAFAECWRTEGYRVLVACFNRTLADELRGALPADVVVETVHGVARGLLEAAGRDPDIPAHAADRGFWSRMLADATDLALAEVPPAWRFDALVVDEGQDMQQDGADVLQLLLPEHGKIVWLEDENQRLYEAPPASLAGFVTWRNRDNYRSPQRIARFLQSLLPISFNARNPVPGDPVHVREVAEADLAATIGERIDHLCAVGYAPDEIVVLTGHGQVTSLVFQKDRLGTHTTRRFRGFTPDGAAQYSDGEIQVETLWRFKGQQAAALILCEFDGDLGEATTARKLYCAATRATRRLEVLVPRGCAMLAPLRHAAGQANAAELS